MWCNRFFLPPPFFLKRDCSCTLCVCLSNVRLEKKIDIDAPTQRTRRSWRRCTLECEFWAYKETSRPIYGKRKRNLVVSFIHRNPTSETQLSVSRSYYVYTRKITVHSLTCSETKQCLCCCHILSKRQPLLYTSAFPCCFECNKSTLCIVYCI